MERARENSRTSSTSPVKCDFAPGAKLSTTRSKWLGFTRPGRSREVHPAAERQRLGAGEVMAPVGLRPQFFAAESRLRDDIHPAALRVAGLEDDRFALAP